MKYIYLIILSLLLYGCSQNAAYEPCGNRVKTGDCYRTYIVNETSLFEMNAQAADRLMTPITQHVSDCCTFLVTTIADINHLHESTPLGRLIGEHLAVRLTESNFNVIEKRLDKGLTLIPKTGEFVLSREAEEIGRLQLAQYAVTGSYAVADDQVYVTLKMIAFDNGKVMSSHAYSLPIDANIHALLQNPNRWW